jgi:hypothetical protein
MISIETLVPEQLWQAIRPCSPLHRPAAAAGPGLMTARRLPASSTSSAPAFPGGCRPAASSAVVARSPAGGACVTGSAPASGGGCTRCCWISLAAMASRHVVGRRPGRVGSRAREQTGIPTGGGRRRPPGYGGVAAAGTHRSGSLRGAADPAGGGRWVPAGAVGRADGCAAAAVMLGWPSSPLAQFPDDVPPAHPSARPAPVESVADVASGLVAAAGRVRVTARPPSGRASAEVVPPWARATARTIDRPSPAPPWALA